MALDNTFAKEFECIVKIMIDPGMDDGLKQDDKVLFELERQIAIERAKALNRKVSNGAIYYQAFLNVLPMIRSNLELVALFSYLSALMGRILSEEQRSEKAKILLKKLFGNDFS